MMYLLDVDGDESTVDLETLRRMAKNNGILDTETMDGTDLSDVIMDCFPDVVVTVMEG